ncbi:BamA/TamA family outer membrane protein [Flavobacterium degerlachei]|jgi:hypothetical protein|uniref:Uncharacterized protein n=1 Tax=Flavobacterium degerlachei TaxID=229203 RepID=A0A1H3BHS3_9FLAO|nr:hypothetical protein [Flavobacterium degerlachei]SDX41325.1 hypothetical protein SAMN05444338_11019 [Flavobacterium degerlachei]
MSKNQKIALLILMLLGVQNSFSQITKQEKDSTEVYKQIHTYSKKNKFTKFMHGLIFKPIKSKKPLPVVKPIKRIAAEDKIIRNIKIITLDPFGYSDTDTLRRPGNWGERTGNRFHLKTKKLAIKDLLLFKKNTAYSLLKIQESERIIRAQKFVNRVTISEEFTSTKADSVDITIRVLDSWSTIPKISVSGSQNSVGLNERNFFGIGHQFDYKFTNRSSDGKTANNLAYTIPNIRNTFIKTKLKYQIDLDNYYEKSISLERPFYSPLTKWAGGISLAQQFRKDTLQGIDSKYENQNFKYSSHDFWIGKSVPIFKGSAVNSKTTNLIISGRFLNINYVESPTAAYDPIDFYSNEKFILSGIGINTRNFIQDQYIFKNGVVEDVPIGRIYGLTLGYQYKNNNWRPYLGAQVSFGSYHKWGFLSTNFELGTFFNKSVTEQTVFSFQANYFTNLTEFGKWKLRQFIKPQVVVGINRQNSIGDELSINGNYGIQGFNSAVYGTNKMVLTLQTQAYAPHDVWGFRLNPYFNYSIALLGQKENGGKVTKAYSKVGIGVIITNDYLVFSSFQLSLSYYPTIPFDGDNIFRTNAFETGDFGLQDFELAKPKTVLFK